MIEIFKKGINKMKKQIKLIFCVICLILGALLVFSSCYPINFRSSSENTSQETGEIIHNIIDNGSLVITNDGNGIPEASSKALRSAVSIICGFKSQSAWSSSGSSAGSGVIYKLDKVKGEAFIITNYHVVYNSNGNTGEISNDIKVYLYGSEIESKAIKATFVGGSMYYDIAVLYVNDSDVIRTSDMCAVDISNSDEIFVGDTAIAVGNAQGYGISTSFGIVSVASEYLGMTAPDGKTAVSLRVIRVDTAVNSGNSGGGLFDKEGNLIGIVNAKIVAESVENIAYAIPSNVAVSIAENIIDYCYGTSEKNVQRAIVGITLLVTDSKAVYDAQTGRMRIVETVAVESVTRGSLADGYFERGDVLVSATLKEKTVQITRQHHIIDLALDLRVGDTVTFNILRNGEEKTVSVTVTDACLTEY